MDDRAGVADQIPGEPPAHGDRKELCRLELLRHDARLGLGAAAGGIEALEREEDHEPDQDGEAGRQNAEHARGSVAVLEVAALGGAPPDEQHGGDRDGRDTEDDEAGPEEGHGRVTDRPFRRSRRAPCR